VRSQQTAGVTQDKASQAAIAKAASDVQKAQTAFNSAVAKSPQVQMQSRKMQVDNYRAAADATGPYTEDEQKYIQFGTKPSGAHPFNQLMVLAADAGVDLSKPLSQADAAKIKDAQQRDWDKKHPTIELTREQMLPFAQAYRAGQPLPSLGTGASGAKARQLFFSLVAELEAKDTVPMVVARASGQAATAALKKRTDQLSNIRAFEGTASDNLDLFLKTAKPIMDTGSPWLNKPLRSVDVRGLGAGDIAAFNAARQVALTEIAKVTNNANLVGVLNESARNEVMGLIPEDATLEQIYKVAGVLKQDMANRRTHLEGEIAELQKQLGGAGPNEKAAPSPATQPPRPASIAGAARAQWSANQHAWRYQMKEGDPWQILKVP